LGNEAKEDETYFPWFKAMAMEVPKTFEEIEKELARLSNKFTKKIFSEEEEEERNDVYIYKTLRYPPKSTPPTAN
jgi:hypothetical protein